MIKKRETKSNIESNPRGILSVSHTGKDFFTGKMVKGGSTPLMIAAYKKNEYLLKILIGSAEINATDKDLRTALHYATIKPSTEMELTERIVDHLLTAKADVSAEDIHHRNALFYSYCNNFKGITKKLLNSYKLEKFTHEDGLWQAIDLCEDTNTTEGFIIAAVIKAIEYNPHEINKEYNFVQQQKVTPLMLACYHHNPNLVRILLKAGANPKALTSTDRSAFHFVLDFAADKDISAVREIFSLLSDAGAQMNDSHPQLSKSLLLIPVCDAEFGIVGYLLTLGIKADRVGKYNNTLLHLLAEGGRELSPEKFELAVMTIRLLHNAGCKLGARNRRGLTALDILKKHQQDPLKKQQGYFWQQVFEKAESSKCREVRKEIQAQCSKTDTDKMDTSADLDTLLPEPAGFGMAR